MLGSVLDIGFEEAALFFGGWVAAGVEGVLTDGIVVIVAPFCEVVCEF